MLISSIVLVLRSSVQKESKFLKPRCFVASNLCICIAQSWNNGSSITPVMRQRKRVNPRLWVILFELENTSVSYSCWCSTTIWYLVTLQVGLKLVDQMNFVDYTERALMQSSKKVRRFVTFPLCPSHCSVPARLSLPAGGMRLKFAVFVRTHTLKMRWESE